MVTDQGLSVSRRNLLRSPMGRGLGIVVIAALLMGIGPFDRLPGARLVGVLVSAPITDWRFVEDAGQCQLETRPHYPHSVTVNCWHLAGQLYIGCMNCQGKAWSHYIDQMPIARVKIADRVYPVALERRTDPSEVTLSWAARGRQLGRDLPVGSVPPHYWLYRVVSR